MIILKHTETDTSHVYEMNKARFWFVLVFLICFMSIGIFYSVQQNNSLAQKLFFGIFFLTVILIIDSISYQLRVKTATLRGKKVVTSGRLWRGEMRIEIEK